MTNMKMNRRAFLFKTAGTVAAGTALSGFSIGRTGGCASAAVNSRPNFVLFYLDDQPYNGMRCTGAPELKTPNMDQLASEGVLFERSFVTTAICCSSRASLYTGQHMRCHGVRDFRTPLTAEQWKKTFPALLRQNGYRTALLGKYAIGAPISGKVPSMPADEFDLWYGFPQMIQFKQVVGGKERYLTTVMTEKATAFLDEVNPDRPFCLIMALKEPHGPLNYWDPEFPDPYTDTIFPLPANLTINSFEALPEIVRNGLNNQSNWLGNPEAYQETMRKLHGYTSRADLAMGQIRQALKQRGLDKNTVIIHTSDNGSMDGAHGLGGKWLMYEESIRVPLVIMDPRLPVSARGRRKQMALNIDLAPTILAMAGIPASDTMQGIDLQPILSDPEAKGREDWYYEHVYNTSPPRRPIPRCEGVRTDRWKYIRYTDPKPPLEQLFDLDADPLEEKDLAGDPIHVDTLLSLRARCGDHRESLAGGDAAVEHVIQ